MKKTKKQLEQENKKLKAQIKEREDWDDFVDSQIKPVGEFAYNEIIVESEEDSLKYGYPIGTKVKIPYFKLFETIL